MELYNMIFQRKSVRSYTGQPVEQELLEKIRAFMDGAVPLDPAIPVRGRILTKDRVRCIFPWVTPQVIAIYTDDSPNAMINAGFLFQQIDLYLHSLGLGTCWLGMGRLDERAGVSVTEEDGLRFAMMLAFGHAKGSTRRDSLREFKRRSPEEISDRPDPRLEPARLAPSSVNSQPWYFIHRGEEIHVYCVRQGLLKKHVLSDMNQFDMGIALAHLYVSSPDTFRYTHKADVPEKKGYGYVGTINL